MRGPASRLPDVHPAGGRPRGLIDRNRDAVVAASQAGRREPGPPTVLGSIDRHALAEANLQRRAFGRERDLRIERAEIAFFGKTGVVPGEATVERRVRLVDVPTLREGERDGARDEVERVARIASDGGFDVCDVAVSSHEDVRPDGYANLRGRLSESDRARDDQYHSDHQRWARDSNPHVLSNCAVFHVAFHGRRCQKDRQRGCDESTPTALLAASRAGRAARRHVPDSGRAVLF